MLNYIFTKIAPFMR